MNPVLSEVLITNLLSNAIRHNIPEGSIRIEFSENTLVITNTGHVLRSDPDFLFERFKKSDHNPESVGLGLSIVKKITDLYSFTISYNHRDGLHKLTILFS